MKIVKISKKDKPKIQEGLKKAFPKTEFKLLNLELNEALKNHIEGYILKDKERVISYMILRRWGRVLHIDTFFVVPEDRGKGYGSKMVEFTKKKCKKQKMKQINLYTYLDKKLINFYEKLGFEKMGILDGPYAPFNEKLIFFKWVINNL